MRNKRLLTYLLTYLACRRLLNADTEPVIYLIQCTVRNAFAVRLLALFQLQSHNLVWKNHALGTLSRSILGIKSQVTYFITIRARNCTSCHCQI